MRRHNLATALYHVHRGNPLTRSSLTARMGLTRSAIGDLLAELDSLGVLAESAPPRNQGSVGRPSPDIRFIAENVYALATQVGTARLRAAVIGFGGTVLARADNVTPRSRDPEQVADALIQLVTELTADLPDVSATIGLGVGIPGLVGNDGVVRLAPSLGWSEVPFKVMLQRRISASVPVILANDGDLGALAEHIRGSGVGRNDMVFVGCDDLGVGGGVIIEGRALRGAGGYASEFGHVVVNPRGRQCGCGGTGCWETEIGLTRVAEALELDGSDSRSLAIALSTLRTPPPRLRDVARYLGLGLANIVNTFNPGLIVLGGNLRELYPAVEMETNAAMAEASLSAPYSQVRLVLAALGADAVLVGAGEAAMELLFTDPVHVLAEAHHGRLR